MTQTCPFVRSACNYHLQLSKTSSAAFNWWEDEPKQSWRSLLIFSLISFEYSSMSQMSVSRLRSTSLVISLKYSYMKFALSFLIDSTSLNFLFRSSNKTWQSVKWQKLKLILFSCISNKFSKNSLTGKPSSVIWWSLVQKIHSFLAISSVCILQTVLPHGSSTGSCKSFEQHLQLKSWFNFSNLDISIIYSC